MGLLRGRIVARVGLPAGLLACLLGCSSGSATGPTATTAGQIRSAGPTASSSPTSVTPSPSSPPSATPDTNGATPAPSWLGTRVLPKGPNGFGVVKATPSELRNRRIITKDLLPPPEGGRFHSTIEAVPADVAQRSTWSKECPVTLSALRYLTVSFVGFDRYAHTGELLVNRTVAKDVVTVFSRLFDAGWPIEEMRITSQGDLVAPPTGDGNDTSAFACRPVRGSNSWSQHAYGLAIDVNPFLNPYVDGDTLLPELATAYTRRNRGLPGMNVRNSVAVQAFSSIGWGWGGDYRSKKDWMHFSSTGK
jgi:hypothetical protein